VNDTDSSPAVVAYRVSRLEDAVTAGFREHNDKLDKLINSFATKEELVVLQKRLDDYKWYWRSIVTAVLLALAASISSIIFKLK